MNDRMRMSGLLVVIVVAACASKSSPKEAVGSGTTTTPPPPPPVADAAPDAATLAKRVPPPPLPKDARPIAGALFATLLNPRDGTRTIHASADGGCHVYVRDPKAPIGPPGSFPPPTTVACPAEMLKPEWGYCLGPGTVHANDQSECICQPGDGDPPGPPFRMPCPK